MHDGILRLKENIESRPKLMETADNTQQKAQKIVIANDYNPQDNDLNRALMQMALANQVIHYPINQDTFIQKGYAYNPHVYTVVTWKCRNKSQVPFELYKIVDKKAHAKYLTHKNLGYYPEAELYKIKALEKIEDGELANIFKRPNEKQSFSQYIYEVSGFWDITGNSYTYGMEMSGFPDGLFGTLHTAPSQLIEIVSGGWLNPIKNYKVCWSNDSATEIPKEQILHIKHWNPKTDRQTGQQLYGMSPLEPHNRTLRRNNELVDASSAMLINGNPGGVLSNDSERVLKTPEQEEQRREFDKRFGGGKNVNRIILAASKVSWQQIGLSSADMELLASDMLDFGTICRAYGLDEIIFNPNKSSYNNKLTAEKAAWQNTLIPELKILRDSLNGFLLPAWSKKDGVQYYCDFDTSNIPCLQTDLKELTERLTPWFDRGTFSQNDILVMMNKEPDPTNEWMNKKWMLNNYHELGTEPKTPAFNTQNDKK